MASDYSSLPPLGAIEAALHKTTETLAREIPQPSDAAPSWNEFEWRIAEATASLHGISALLAERLRWRGPDRWQAFLAEQKRQTQLRREVIMKLLERIDRQMRHTGIACVALKGAALYRLGLYPGGERTMGDVDLLVKNADFDAASRLLTALDYRESFRTWRHRVFEPVVKKDINGLGEHAGNPLKIELHARIAERLPIHETDITALQFPVQAHSGINPYPSTAALLRHLLLHAAGNLRARALRFNQLHDVALLAARMSDMDWDELLHEGGETGGIWWAFAPLTLTARYYSNSIPPVVIEAAAAGCPPLLRWASQKHRLVDVSWSKIRIQAFPGIEWSQSLTEAFKFMASRVLPGRAALRELHEGMTGLPYMTAVPWYDLSHTSRILRWLFSQPPRVQTIYPVQLALGSVPASISTK